MSTQKGKSLVKGNDSEALFSGPVKRKRGRPRKNPLPNGSNETLALVPTNFQNDGDTSVAPTFLHHNHIGNVGPVPPGFGCRNESNPRHGGSRNDPQDLKVGQAVTAIVAAEFDDGYLVTVRIENSDLTLGGVVFKLAKYIPVSPNNDVAPKAPVNHRETDELHCSSVTNADTHLGAVEGKSVCWAREERTGLRIKEMSFRGRKPVVYQPSSCTKPPHLMAIKVKQAFSGADPSNSAAQSVPDPIFRDQMILTKAQASRRTMSKDIHCESGPCNKRSAQLSQEAETKSLRLQGKSFNPLMDGNSSVECSDHKLEDRPLSAGSLRTVRPDQSVSFFKPPEKYRTTRMTELLQVVQGSASENEASLTEEAASASKNSGA